MPRQYEAIRDAFIANGVSKNEAQKKAAKIYIAKGKGGSRSSRAKKLHKD